MKKLILIAVMLASTQAHAKDPEVTASLKATCYAYLYAHKDQQPEAFDKAKKLALADTYAHKYVANQTKLFMGTKAEVFKPMALHNCRKLNINAK